MSRKKTLIISSAIILISVVLTFIIFLTAPEADREGATRTTAMLVEVVEVQRGDFTPTVVATGNVEAATDITLSTQVGGEVISISDKFIPGSYVKKGEILLQINPADYQNMLQLRQSDLALAKADLSIEMGRQEVAVKDYELIGDEFSAENRDLVLRKPQLESSKALIAAAEASVSQARLDLERTTIRAPFDAHILSRNANIGSQLVPGSELGRLVGMKEYWVIANVPIAHLNWLEFSEGATESGSEVKIYNQNSWSGSQYREGRLYRLVGALDAQTRLARVLVAVTDPLLRLNPSDSLPPLMIGTFVEAHIQAREIPDVVRLNRDHLRQESTVWVLNNGKLDIRQVDILFQDAEHAYIKEGLADRDQVVTTDLSTVVEGSDLRTEANSASRELETEEVQE